MKRIINLFVFITILITGCNKTNEIKPIIDENVNISTEIKEQEDLNKTMYVNSPEGLRVRNLPGVNGDIIGLLDYLTEVKIIKEDYNIVSIEGIEGKWVNIITPIEGWVFNGFLENEEQYKNRLNEIFAAFTPNNMVPVYGGTFMMGSHEDEPWRYDVESRHQVTLSSFYMGKYPVTQREYLEIMGTNPSFFIGDNLPVENVNWYDAIVFCNKLSMIEGLTPAYSINGSADPAAWGFVPRRWDEPWTAVQIVTGSNGYRLPTEAQWEYACRAGTTTPFSTGDNITTDQANYNGNHPYNGNPAGLYRERTTEVGIFAPNAWELYDMHGNVWEWCWNWYDEYSIEAQNDPVGASSGSNRVHRGGSSYNDAQYLRSAYRGGEYPSYQGNGVGFRFVRP
jgi:formylglycine-generating enzyme required for sulfatase activity